MVDTRMGRDIRFDVLKAIAIGLVVFGHVASTNALGTQGFPRIDAFIVGLNMPLFFAISGYFSCGVARDFGKLITRCAKYLKCMLAYAILIAIVFYGLGIWDLALAAKRAMSIPLFGWWYMWVLMLAMTALWIIERITPVFQKWKVAVVLVPLALYIVLLFLPDSFWQARYFKFNFPFFLLGYWVRKRATDVRLLPFGLFVWICSALFYGIYLWKYTAFPCAFYWGDFGFFEVFRSVGAFWEFLLRFMVGISGVITIAWPILALKQVRLTCAIAEFGTTTMGVYFLHQAALRHLIVPLYVGSKYVSLLVVVSVSFVLWVMCHLVVTFLNEHRITQKVFKP